MKYSGKFLGWVWASAGNFALIAGWLVTIAVPAWLVQARGQFAEWAPASWLLVGLVCGLASASAFALVSWGWHRLKLAQAASEWSKRVDAINPLDEEFHRKRINLADMVSPANNAIFRKRFVSCELLGPFTFIPREHTRIADCTFTNCNVVSVPPGVTVFGISVVECVLQDCSLSQCTILFPQHVATQFASTHPTFQVLGLPAAQGVAEPVP